jgi:adenosylmethionine-8-amino-7-oxononanoate aminotransferase
MDLPSHTIDLDRRYLWHPFTWIDAWEDPAFEPVVIERGEGSELIDTNGRRYLDGNASIWTNLHGHNHPRLNAALKQQLDRIAHSSFLGLTNDVAPFLGRDLIEFLNGSGANLARVFYSDDGSTAMECGLKIAYQFFQQNGQPQRTRFISLGSAYHGDTVGAMSLGHSPVFHRAYRDLLFESQEVMPPACYRCPYNKADPEKQDARFYRKCNFECADEVERAFGDAGDTAAGWVVEPRVQGAAGFLMHPEGYLARTSEIARASGAKVILDEVMTGFGRTGAPFAFHHEKSAPDVVALAKGLTAGYMPMAATAVTEEIFDGFRGDRSKTFFHGHSYTGNQLGCAVAAENLRLLEEPDSVSHRQALETHLRNLSGRFWDLDHVGDVRQEGLVLAIELVEDFASRKPFDPEKRVGVHVCEQARPHGLLTRPVGDVLLLMPPYSTTKEQLERMVEALYSSIDRVTDPTSHEAS